MEDHPEAHTTIKKREDPPVRGQQADMTQFRTLNTVNRDHHKHQDYSKLQRTAIWNNIEIRILIDSGADGNFISPRIINQGEVPWVKKENPYRLGTVEGDPVAYDSGMITRETARAPLTLFDVQNENIIHQEEEAQFDIAEIGRHDAILGMPWLRKHNPQIDWITGQIRTTWHRENGSIPRRRDLAAGEAHEDRRDTSKSETIRILAFTDASIPADQVSEEHLEFVPEEYRQYGQLFCELKSLTLPKHGPWDHEIELKEGTEPKFHRIYSLSAEQLEVLREYIKENLKKGHIRPSQSSAGYPILFVPKKDGSLRLCVDYRQLNAITKKNCHPLPLIAELKDRLFGAVWFTVLDLPGAYSMIRIKEGHEWKTAFRTKYGNYEYLILPFGLTNAPATFQAMINHVLRRFIDHFIVVYLDDILIFSKTLEEHQTHVHQVLQALRDADLRVNPKKSTFHSQEVEYLGFKIRPGRIEMSDKKVEAVRSWPTPTSVKEVRGFLGFANFYRRFIEGFGRLAAPLTELTKKDKAFEWTKQQQTAFDDIKYRILSKPILVMADPEKPFEVETDASDFALGGQLAQRDAQGRLHPVAFFSKKLHGPELNYPIHDKELMAIIESFKEWRPYLSGTKHQVKVYTDHKNLTYFTTSKDLNQRQVRWSEFLSEFNFQIIYRKGSENGRADALSRRPDHFEGREEQDTQPILKKEQDGSLTRAERELNVILRLGQNARWLAMLQDWRDDQKLEELKEVTNDLFLDKPLRFWAYRNKAYVPSKHREALIKEFHASPAHGHQGIAKTYERFKRHFDFPGSKAAITTMIKDCEVCARTKASRHKPYGELQALPVPARAWASVTMDLIVKLPRSRDPVSNTSYDSILVIVERLTKYGRFVPINESHTAEDLTNIVIREIVSNHGLPDEIITDRGTTFASRFFTALTARLGVNSKLSTAFHPQTDGQTERLNQTLEQYLRCYINYDQDDWVEHLPMAQYAYNTATTETTKVSPFFANHGFNPDIHKTPTLGPDNPQATLRADQLQDLHKHLQQELSSVRTRMAKYYNTRRMKGPSLKEGDKAYLLRKNITTKRPSDKLDFKKLGPFIISRKISENNYELSLPKTMRIHPIFHISLLEPAPKSAQPQKGRIEVAPNQEYEVEAILNERRKGRGKQYLIRWKGFDSSEDTWEPVKNLTGCREAFQRFQESRDRPTSQGPKRSRKEATNRPRRSIQLAQRSWPLFRRWPELALPPPPDPTPPPRKGPGKSCGTPSAATPFFAYGDEGASPPRTQSPSPDENAAQQPSARTTLKSQGRHNPPDSHEGTRRTSWCPGETLHKTSRRYPRNSSTTA
jgi:hypothetical protein